jgi:hypothetical protein
MCSLLTKQSKHSEFNVTQTWRYMTEPRNTPPSTAMLREIAHQPHLRRPRGSCRRWGERSRWPPPTPPLHELLVRHRLTAHLLHRRALRPREIFLVKFQEFHVYRWGPKQNSIGEFHVFQKEKLNLFESEPKFWEFHVFRHPLKFFSYLWGLRGRNLNRAHGVSGEQVWMASGNDRARIAAPAATRRAATCRCMAPPRAVDCCV